VSIGLDVVGAEVLRQLARAEEPAATVPGILERLGDDGIAAVAGAVAEHETAADVRLVAGNSDGTPS
jgi:NaMN:DMB phosphoribosyltransferase